MIDGLKMTSAADLLWYGVGYSAFAVVNATLDQYSVQFINTNNEQKYFYSVANTRASRPRDPSHDDQSESSAGRESKNDSIVSMLRTWRNNPAVVMSGGLISIAFLLAVCFVMYSRIHSKSALKVKASKPHHSRNKHPLRYEHVDKPTKHKRRTMPTDLSDSDDEETGGGLLRATSPVSKHPLLQQFNSKHAHATPELCVGSTASPPKDGVKSSTAAATNTRSPLFAALRLHDTFGARITPDDIRTNTIDGRVLHQTGQAAKSAAHRRATTLPV